MKNDGKDREPGEALEDMIVSCFGEYSPENYEKAVHVVASLEFMGIVTSEEANRIISKMDEIDTRGE